METAVAYIRVSSQRQVEAGSSLDSQAKQVERFAHAANLKISRVFREEGESAKTDRRPQLQEMLRHCRSPQSGVTVVVVPKIDRLARNVYDYTKLKLQLHQMGIRLESLGERIEDTPVGRFTETMLASVAQFDNEIRSERCRGGMVEAVEQGRWVWSAPIGYRNVRHHGKGTIEPEPRTAPLITDAFRQLAYGNSSRKEVWDHLQQSGLELSRAAVYRLVRNPVYIGEIHAFGGVFQAAPPFEPLIDPTTFQLARKAARRHSASPKSRTKVSEHLPLRGVLRCVKGHYYTGSFSRGAQGKRYPYYRCIKCKGQNHPAKLVHEQFVRELHAFRGTQSGWARVLRYLKEDEARAERVRQEQADRARAEIERLEKLRSNLARKIAEDVLPDDLGKQQIERLTEEIAEARLRLPSSDPKLSLDELVLFAQHFFETLPANWATFSAKTKKDLLGFLYPDGLFYLGAAGFRTPASSLSEQLKPFFSQSESQVVDPPSADLNTLLKGLCRLMNGSPCQ